MIRPAIIATSLLFSLAMAGGKPTVLVVTGAPGAEDYGQLFEQWGQDWKSAAEQADAGLREVGQPKEGSAKEQLEKILVEENKEGSDPLWLIFLGHGTFNGKEAKFNLRGPDLEASELSAWLLTFKRPLAIINCSSSSAPFLKKLSAKGRIVVTATRSGYEQNFCHLGGHLATAMSDLEADLDKDGQVSLLEGWLTAARRTARFYEENGRLATEHSLLDDNADGKGTQADWFRGLQVTKKSAEEGLLPDGLRAHQLHLIPSEEERKLSPDQKAKRNALEIELASLRAQKSKLREDAYYERLETLLIEMSRIYFPGEASTPPGE